MALSHSPSIVTDGLVLCLDAANPKSYPGSGTTWTDLSGLGNNGTLTNGPSYNSSNGGSLVFGGTNEHVELGANSNIQSIGSYATIECWFKSSALGTSTFSVMVGWGQENAYFSNFGIGNWGGFSAQESIFLGYNSLTVCYADEGSSKYHDGNWHHAVATIGPNSHKIYVDGVEKTLTFGSVANSYSVPNVFGFSPTTTLQVGRRPFGSGTGYFPGSIPTVKIYNRALSAQEIQQNFNALRGRFGI